MEKKGLWRNAVVIAAVLLLAVGGSAIAFTPDGYPCWHTDTNGNGRIDADEFKPANSYKAYTPRLAQALCNCTFVLRHPGAAYHDGTYAAQLRYDSLESLAASGKVEATVKGKGRPIGDLARIGPEVRPPGAGRENQLPFD